MRINEFGQPIGDALENWQGCTLPSKKLLEGRYCRLESIDMAKHANDLFSAFSLGGDGLWTYLNIGPYQNLIAFMYDFGAFVASNERLHYAIIDSQTEKVLGTLALMKADVVNGSVEVGWVVYSPLLKHSRIATEAQFLLMKYVFDELAYRRYEWKCDSLNIASCNAALRLGFKMEGVFRQMIVYKGRNRDTTWLSIIDSEWPKLKQGFENWLKPENFDAKGRQKTKLSFK